MAQTYKGTKISIFIKDLIEANRSTLTRGGVNAVFYGDQRIIVGGKTVCVEPSRKIRSVRTTGHGFENTFETSIIIYSSGDQGVEQVQLVADELMEAVEDLVNLHASPASLGIGGTQFGGLIGQGWCEATEHSYRVPSSQTTRANRIIFTSKSRTSLYLAS